MRLAGNLQVGCHVRLESLWLAVHNEMDLGANEIARNLARLVRSRYPSVGEVMMAMVLLEADNHG